MRSRLESRGSTSACPMNSNRWRPDVHHSVRRQGCCLCGRFTDDSVLFWRRRRRGNLSVAKSQSCRKERLYELALRSFSPAESVSPPGFAKGRTTGWLSLGRGFARHGMPTEKSVLVATVDVAADDGYASG